MLATRAKLRLILAMSNPNQGLPGHTLNPNLVRILIDPEDPSWPRGHVDPLSTSLYRLASEGDAAGVMTALVDQAEEHLYKPAGYGFELNEMRVERLFALVADMPASLPDEARLLAWQHLARSDWVHVWGHHDSFRRAMSYARPEDPEFFDNMLLPGIKTVFEEKCAIIEENIGFSDDIPEVLATQDGHDYSKEIDGFLNIKEHYPEFEDTYHTMLVLASSIRGFEPFN